MENDNIYELILESDLMDEIWSKLDATTKVEVLQKSGWDLFDEWVKRHGEAEDQEQI